MRLAALPGRDHDVNLMIATKRKAAGQAQAEFSFDVKSFSLASASGGGAAAAARVLMVLAPSLRTCLTCGFTFMFDNWVSRDDHSWAVRLMSAMAVASPAWSPEPSAVWAARALLR